MKAKIFRYELNDPGLLIGSPFKMKMIKGASILTVQYKKEQYSGWGNIWAVINPDEPEIEERIFLLIPTGHEFNVSMDIKYIGTYQVPHNFKGQIQITVLHLWEIID